RLRAFAGHPGIVYAVAWGLSDDLVVSGGGNGNLRWWDVQSGECVRVRQAHHGTVQSLRRSPGGPKLASCGDVGARMLWDLPTVEHLQTLRRDRPYERMDITGLSGISEAQRALLIALGAREGLSGQHAAATNSALSIAVGSHTADDRQRTGGDRNEVI